MKKYELIEPISKTKGINFYQIKCIKAFSDIKIGELGGWIEKESNLNQTDNSWISENARVSGNARIYDNAQIHGSGRLYGKGLVCVLL